jgi:tetratricopeptide (TPR) repeat protein
MRTLHRLSVLTTLFLAATFELHAARERPGGDDPFVAQVESVLRDGDLLRAVQLLDVALRQRPQALYFAMRGGLRGELADLPGAIEDLGEAVKLDPKLAVAWRDRGTARVLLRQYDLAREDFDQAVKLDPEEPRALAARASLNLQCGACDAAIADASAALKLDPRMIHALFDRASALAQKGELRPALADFNSMLEVQPRHALGLTSRAQVYRRLGDLERALQDIDLSIQADPNSPAAYAERATIRGALGDFSRAVADCTTALLIDGGFRDALMVRSILYIQSGEFAKAREDFETALRDPGSDPAVTRHNLAWLLATSPDGEVRDAPRAIALAREAIDRFGDQSPHVFDALAAASAEMGDFVGAVENAERSVQATDARNPLELASRRDRLELYRNQRVYRLPNAPLELERATAAAEASQAAALIRSAEYAKAKDLLEESIRHNLAPHAATLSALAWLLSTSPDETQRDGARAVTLSRKAIALGAGTAGLDALAAASAETSDFPAAIEAAQQALDRTDPEDTDQTSRRRERLERYRDGDVWRLPPAAARRATLR